MIIIKSTGKVRDMHIANGVLNDSARATARVEDAPQLIILFIDRKFYRDLD